MIVVFIVIFIILLVLLAVYVLVITNGLKSDSKILEKKQKEIIKKINMLLTSNDEVKNLSKEISTIKDDVLVLQENAKKQQDHFLFNEKKAYENNDIVTKKSTISSNKKNISNFDLEEIDELITKILKYKQGLYRDVKNYMNELERLTVNNDLCSVQEKINEKEKIYINLQDIKVYLKVIEKILNQANQHKEELLQNNTLLSQDRKLQRLFEDLLRK